MLYFLGVLIFTHGILHLLGFTHAFGLGAQAQLDIHISKPLGVLWLSAAILYVSTSVLVFLKIDNWWIMAFAVMLFSQLLIITAWEDARYGTITNLIILIAIVLSWCKVW